jgi:ATP-dependent Clp protease ATP-binding subunit ClpA
MASQPQPPHPTERVNRVLSLATDEADSLGHGFVTCQHILYALARETKGLATAALEALDLSADTLHALLEETAALHDRTSKGRIDMADEARDSFERAVQAASEWGHALLDTEHLLYGILSAPTSADEMLDRLQVDPNAVLNQAYQLMQSAPAPQIREEATHAAYRFTLETTWVLSLAANQARRMGGERVSSLYLLLALMTLENTVAHEVLVSQFGMDAERIMTYLQGATVPKYTKARIPLNEDVQRVLGYAIGEAWNRGHASVRPIHLLMGLARSERAIALDVLAEYGIPRSTLAEAVEAAMPPAVRS